MNIPQLRAVQVTYIGVNLDMIFKQQQLKCSKLIAVYHELCVYCCESKMLQRNHKEFIFGH